MARLFPHLPFLNDETQLSWAARLAALHGSRTLRPFLTDNGIRPIDLITGQPAAIDRLCEVSGQDPARVRHNTAVSDGRFAYSLRGERLPVSMTLRDETRFCPLCLHEDDAEAGGAGFARRSRLAWSLRPVATCDRHDLALVSRLRARGEDGLHGIRELVPERGRSLIAIADQLVRRKPSPLQSYVTGRLERKSGPAWLDGQSIEQAVKATEMLGVSLAFGTKINLGSVDADGWDLAGRTGWEWTCSGEPGLHAAFSGLQATAFARGQGGQNYFTVFGQLYRWLLERGERTDHGPIKMALRDYIVKNMDVCPGRELLGEVVGQRSKYSVQSLAVQAGLHRQTLCKVLVEQDLIRDEDADRPTSILLVDAEAGRKVAAALARSVQFLQLPALLNATRPVAECLIKLGLLNPLHRGSGKNTRDKCGFDVMEVDRLINRVHRLAPEKSDLPDAWATLTQCTKRARIPMKQLLRLILDGRIEGIGRPYGQLGFNALRVDIEEIRRRTS